MTIIEIAYCNTCENLIDFTISDETIEEDFKGKRIVYPFIVGRCKLCGSEVATDIDYNFRKSNAKWKAYKKTQ